MQVAVLDVDLKVLILEKKDFELTEAQAQRVTKHKGIRFSYLIVPEQYKEHYTDMPIFKYIRGSLYVGDTLKAQLITI